MKKKEKKKQEEKKKEARRRKMKGREKEERRKKEKEDEKVSLLHTCSARERSGCIWFVPTDRRTNERIRTKPTFDSQTLLLLLLFWERKTDRERKKEK